jgi:formiminotetrahydrofolate cyclodeaminase
MRRAIEILEVAKVAAEHGNSSAISDAGIAGRMAHAACHGASFNVAINIRSLRDLSEGDAYRREAMDLVKSADRLVEEVDRVVRSRISG